MRYTNYFGQHFKEHGQPHLNNDCYKQYFNLVCIENKIHGMELLKKKYKGTPEYYKYDMEIDSLQKQIFQMTTDDKPEFFLLELLKKSANY
ncbi:hypothetical protein JBL43_10680 [Aureibaculum sp. A20]|uniref:Uncharacterized protein n=1 Tax=Aureibaculum flavum TaxID=2795986 RepID=A0ABS0WRV9_9FLAO|nr:hypothetical protein [Aureibaculum flavum]MBJ2174703.1 hypothetical protein [Aureibaculum flavum]